MSYEQRNNPNEMTSEPDDSVRHRRQEAGVGKETEAEAETEKLISSVPHGCPVFPVIDAEHLTRMKRMEILLMILVAYAGINVFSWLFKPHSNPYHPGQIYEQTDADKDRQKWLRTSQSQQLEGQVDPRWEKDTLSSVKQEATQTVREEDAPMQGMAPQHLPPVADDAGSTNPLFYILRDVMIRPGEKMADNTPLFWNLPPNNAGGMQMKNILDKCFDLTRAEVVGGDGTHNIEHISQSHKQKLLSGLLVSEGAAVEEDVLIMSNLGVLPAVFNPTQAQNGHQTAKMFSFFLHPVYRSAYMFKYLKTAKNDPHYDERIEGLDLLAYLQFLHRDGNEYHMHQFRMNNWITRSLTGKPRDAKLGKEDVEMATNILRKKCLIGLYDNMEESLQRLGLVFGWNVGDSIECLSKAGIGGSIIDGSFVGTDEWRILLQMNREDVALYENMKLIFQEQGEKLGRSVQQIPMVEGMQQVAAPGQNSDAVESGQNVSN